MSSPDPSATDPSATDPSDTEPSDTDHEETVVVDRDRHVDEATVVVDRGSNERTIAVDRSSRDDDGATVTVDRSKPASESTVVADRGAQSKTPTARGPRGRQRINLPPVEPGFAERATLAAGPGAVESYAPRELPAQPVHAPSQEHVELVTRAPAEDVPSVRKASRQFGVVAVFGFIVACAVSVIGLSVILFLVLRGL